MTRPELLVVAAGDREYRGYMLERLARDYRLLLLSPHPVTWESSYIEDYRLIRADDDAGSISRAEELAQQHSVAGVLTYHEPCVELVSRIGQRLDLPHCDPAAAARCRDKFASKTAFQAAGIPSARFVLVSEQGEAIAAARSMGWPVVVKPRALSASFGVTLANDVDELVAAFEYALELSLPEPWVHQRGVLIEEFLDGPEVSVDSLVWDGRARPMAFALKQLGFPPNFEEVSHIVGAAAQVTDQYEQVEGVVVAAHTALGLNNLATHTEVKLTADGPKVIEVNGRMGGDMIPYLAELASGVDLISAAGHVATGDTSDLGGPGTPTRAAGVHFVYADGPGTVRRPQPAEWPEWLEQLTWLVADGSRIDPEPGSLYFARLGYAIVTADSVMECEQRIEETAVLFDH